MGAAGGLPRRLRRPPRRPPSTRQLVDQELTEHIGQAHQRSKGRYGAPRIHAQLRRDGHRHGRKRIARLLRAAGLHGRTPRRFDVTTVLWDMSQRDLLENRDVESVTPTAALSEEAGLEESPEPDVGSDFISLSPKALS